MFKIYSNLYDDYRKEIFETREEAEAAIASNPWDAEEEIIEI